MYIGCDQPSLYVGQGGRVASDVMELKSVMRSNPVFLLISQVNHIQCPIHSCHHVTIKMTGQCSPKHLKTVNNRRGQYPKAEDSH
jgi:hypothetical protein